MMFPERSGRVMVKTPGRDAMGDKKQLRRQSAPRVLFLMPVHGGTQLLFLVTK